MCSCDDERQRGRVQEEGQVILRSAQCVVGHQWEKMGPGGHVRLPHLQYPGPGRGERGTEEKLVGQVAQRGRTMGWAWAETAGS